MLLSGLTSLFYVLLLQQATACCVARALKGVYLAGSFNVLALGICPRCPTTRRRRSLTRNSLLACRP